MILNVSWEHLKYLIVLRAVWWEERSRHALFCLLLSSIPGFLRTAPVPHDAAVRASVLIFLK